MTFEPSCERGRVKKSPPNKGGRRRRQRRRRGRKQSYLDLDPPKDGEPLFGAERFCILDNPPVKPRIGRPYEDRGFDQLSRRGFELRQLGNRVGKIQPLLEIGWNEVDPFTPHKFRSDFAVIHRYGVYNRHFKCLTRPREEPGKWGHKVPLSRLEKSALRKNLKFFFGSSSVDGDIYQIGLYITRFGISKKLLKSIKQLRKLFKLGRIRQFQRISRSLAAKLAKVHSTVYAVDFDRRGLKGQSSGAQPKLGIEP